MHATVTAFTRDNLVSSRAEDGALMLDPAFINASGLAILPAGAGGHWWIAAVEALPSWPEARRGGSAEDDCRGLSA